MKDKTLLIKTILFLAAGFCLIIGLGSWVIGYFTDVIKGIPLPNVTVFLQGVIVVLIGFFTLWAIDKIAERFKQTFEVEIVKKIILTFMLVFAAYVPLYYSYYWWLPTILKTRFPLMETRMLLFMMAILFPVVAGSSYYLISKIWPDIGHVRKGVLLSTLVVLIVVTTSLWQQPVKLFNRDGTSDVYYHSTDFTPYYHLGEPEKDKKHHDERDGAELKKLAKETDKEDIKKIQAKIPNIKGILWPPNWFGSREPKKKAKTKLAFVKKYEFEVTCIGFEGGVDDMGGVETPLTNGIHYQKGYYLEAIGNPGFEVWHSARYQDYQGRYFKKNLSSNKGSNFSVRGPKGAKVLVRSYKWEKVEEDNA